MYLAHFQSRRPKYQISQEDSINWLAAAHTRTQKLKDIKSENLFDSGYFFSQMERLIRRFGCNSDSIQTRGHELPDFSHQNWDKMELFHGNTFPTIEQRMHFFQETVDRVVEDLCSENKPLPKHIVHVTCTGYSSPSAVQKLVSNRKEYETRITHLYHMGCYASLPAIRTAQGIVQFESTPAVDQVDMVHNELCSLHVDLSSRSPEQLVVQSLFSDGHIKYSVVRQPPENGFRILDSHEIVIPNSLEEMSWNLSNEAFQMTLSRKVPQKIKLHLEGFFEKLLDCSATSKQELIFAIHPGGPRIIDEIQEILQLESAQIEHSRSILREHGNMSSATLPHIWERILDSSDIEKGQRIASVAFGPGLTVSGNLIEKIC